MLRRELQSDDFNKYPHYVFATAYLLDGKLVDYKIQNRERDWYDRTFRGDTWENEAWDLLNKNSDRLSCQYSKIWVSNDDEHNEAFEHLERWLDDCFEKHEKVKLRIW